MTLRLFTVAAAALALILPFGPVAASASTTGSTQAVAVGTDDLAAMHNELISSDPTDGAQITAGPPRVTLIFDLPAQRGFSAIVVTGPDSNQWQAGPAVEDGATVSAPVRPLGPAGEYTIAWRIISSDGHPTGGTLGFTLTTPGPGAAVAPPDAGRSVNTTPATDTGFASTLWPWLAGAGALLLVGVVMALRVSRSRR